MSFDPNQPFDVVPPDKPAFDASKPFDAVPQQTPPTNSKSPFDPNAQFEPITKETRTAQELADDSTYTPAQAAVGHAEESPEWQQAYAAQKARDNASILTKTGRVAAAAIDPQNWLAAGKGLVSFGEGLISTPAHAIAQGALEAGNALGFNTGPEAKTQEAQAVLSGQNVEQGIVGKFNALGKWIEPMMASTPEEAEAAHRSYFKRTVKEAENQQNLAQGKPLDTGIVASFATGLTPGVTPSSLYSPEALKTAGAAPVDQSEIARESAAADPMNLALAAATMLPGAQVVGGRLVQAVGKGLQLPMEGINAARGAVSNAGRLLTGAAAGTTAAELATGALHTGLAVKTLGGALATAGLAKLAQAGGDILEQAGKEAATGIPSEATQAAATARGAGGLNIGAEIKSGIGRAATAGATTAAAFAPLNFAMSGGDPEEFAKSEIGAAVFGAGTGAVQGARDAMTAAQGYRLEQYGNQKLSDNPNYDAHQAQMSQFAPQDQSALNRLRGFFHAAFGVDTLVLDGQTYAQQTGNEGQNSRGFMSPDGTLYLNADAIHADTPDAVKNAAKAGTAANTAGHEAGHAVVKYLADSSAQAEVDGLYKTITGALTPEDLASISKEYSGALDRSTTGGKATNQANIPEENLAEITRKILSGQDIASFALPKPIAAKLTDIAARFMESHGMSPQIGDDQGLAFKTRMVKEAARRMKDLLFDAGKRASGNIADWEQSAERKIDDLQKQLDALPPTPATMALKRVETINAQRKELTKQINDLQAMTREKTPLPKSTANATLDKIRAMRDSGNPQPQAASTDTQETPSIPSALTPQQQYVKDHLTGQGRSDKIAEYYVRKFDGTPATIQDMMSGIGNGGRILRPATPKPISQPTATTPATKENPVAGTTPSESPIPATEDEKSPPGKSVSTITGEGEQKPPENNPTARPIPVQTPSTVGDFDKIAAETKERFLADKAPAKAGKNKGQHTKANQQAADREAFYAAAQAHADSVPPNYQGMKLHEDAFGRKYVSGTIDPSRAFDAWLILQSDDAGHMEGKTLDNILNFQKAKGTTVSYDYGHAPVDEEGEQPTGESRRAQQAASPANERAARTAAKQTEVKTSIPLDVAYNYGQKSFTIPQASPEKLLNNFNHITEAMGVAGEPVPYRDINDPKFVSDFKGAIRNHRNGWKADGSAPIVGTDEYPRTDTEGYQPYKNPDVQKTDFINMLLADESLKSQTKEGNPTDQASAKAHFANENKQPYTEQGEANGLRQRINDSIGSVEDRNGKQTTWSLATLEDPLGDSIRPDLADNIRPASTEDASIRQHGKLGDLGRFFDGGLPDKAATSGNFMPQTGEQKDEYTGQPTIIKGRSVNAGTSRELASRLERAWSSVRDSDAGSSPLHGIQATGSGAENDNLVPRISGTPFRDSGTSQGAEKRLVQFASGRETGVFRSPEGAIYKVFDPQPNGGIGVQKVVEQTNGGTIRSRLEEGNLATVLDKLRVLSKSGGVPSEIHGITEDGSLVVKQPGGYKAEIESAEQLAASSKSLIRPIPKEAWSELDKGGYVTVIEGKPYMISDLHGGNIVRDNSMRPRFIDLDASPIPSNVLQGLPKLRAEVTKLSAAERIQDRTNNSFMPNTRDMRQLAALQRVKDSGDITPDQQKRMEMLTAKIQNPDPDEERGIDMLHNQRPRDEDQQGKFMPAERDNEIYRKPGKTIDISEDTKGLPEGYRIEQNGGLWIAYGPDGKRLPDAATGSRAATLARARIAAKKEMPSTPDAKLSPSSTAARARIASRERAIMGAAGSNSNRELVGTR